MLARNVGDYIAFTTELGSTTLVNAQPDDLDQLLTSLVTAGRDLLPAGGSIVVDVRQEETAGAAPDGFGVPGPVLAIRASGYGVQKPSTTPSLELLAQRCGGVLHTAGENGWLARIEVVFPRCGMPTRPGWDWTTD
jgi:hypothetical protein